MPAPLSPAEFAKAVTESARTIPAALVKDVVTRVSLEALSKIVMRSPVDTGRFRGAWQVTLGSPATTETGARDPAGGATIENGQRVILEAPPFPFLIIANPVPYGPVLEFGGYDPPNPLDTPEAMKKRARGRTPAQRADAQRLLGNEGATKVAGGFTKQAPQGVVGITFTELVALLDRIVEATR